MNTRDNRASAVAVGMPFGRAFWLPDGVIEQPDRQHAALTYRAIESLALSAVGHRTVTVDFTGRTIVVDNNGRVITVAGAPRTIQ